MIREKQPGIPVLPNLGRVLPNLGRTGRRCADRQGPGLVGRARRSLGVLALGFARQGPPGSDT